MLLIASWICDLHSVITDNTMLWIFRPSLFRVLELLEASPLHYLHGVEFLFNRIFPSLLNGQFRLLMKEDKPLAFVNWAWLNDKVSEEFSHYGHQLGPDVGVEVGGDAYVHPHVEEHGAALRPGRAGRW